MNVVVILKQTPDTESVIRIAGDGKSILTNDLKWIINPYDEFAVEAALRLKELNPDVVLCGSRAVDYDLAQRGAMVAELLGWPHLALAVSLESDGSKVTAERPIEGGKLTLEADLPALVTLGGSHAVWNPRYASLPGIMKAKKKPLAMKKLADLGVDEAQCSALAAKIQMVSLEMPPQRAAGRLIEGEDAAAKARELVRALHDEAKVI